MVGAFGVEADVRCRTHLSAATVGRSLIDTYTLLKRLPEGVGVLEACGWPGRIRGTSSSEPPLDRRPPIVALEFQPESSPRSVSTGDL